VKRLVTVTRADVAGQGGVPQHLTDHGSSLLQAGRKEGKGGGVNWKTGEKEEVKKVERRNKGKGEGGRME
jgi:hypothetical protein